MKEVSGVRQAVQEGPSGTSTTEETMNSHKRVCTALRHREPDRVPFDLGGMAQSGISRKAYANLRRYLGLPEVEIRLLNIITQVARLDADFQERLEIDTDLVYGKWASSELASPIPSRVRQRHTWPRVWRWIHADSLLARTTPRDSAWCGSCYRT